MSDKKSQKKENSEEHSEMIFDEKASEQLEKEQKVESPKEVEEEVMEHELEEKPREEILEEELQDYKDKYLRLYSEFENFRRRTNKEKLDTITLANEKLIAEILPVIDDFERANAVFLENGDQETYSKGAELIYQKLKSTLESRGLRKMEALLKDFEPDLHEAITQIPVEDKKKKGKVVDVLEEGYYLHDKVVRFAKVVVGQSDK